jgi:hypothetical protein
LEYLIPERMMMFRDTTEWIKAVRNSSMNSKRQDRLIKEIRDYERAGVWNDKRVDKRLQNNRTILESRR